MSRSNGASFRINEVGLYIGEGGKVRMCMMGIRLNSSPTGRAKTVACMVFSRSSRVFLTTPLELSGEAVMPKILGRNSSGMVS